MSHKIFISEGKVFFLFFVLFFMNCNSYYEALQMKNNGNKKDLTLSEDITISRWSGRINNFLNTKNDEIEWSEKESIAVPKKELFDKNRQKDPILKNHFSHYKNLRLSNSDRLKTHKSLKPRNFPLKGHGCVLNILYQEPEEPIKKNHTPSIRKHNLNRSLMLNRSIIYKTPQRRRKISRDSDNHNNITLKNSDSFNVTLKKCDSFNATLTNPKIEKQKICLNIKEQFFSFKNRKKTVIIKIGHLTDEKFNKKFNIKSPQSLKLENLSLCENLMIHRFETKKRIL